MTVVYWILGIIGYLAIAVAVMRWRTARINAGKPWHIIMYEGQLESERARKNAHQFTTAVGLFWPLAYVLPAFLDLIFIALWIIWQGLDHVFRFLVGLPRK